ncbi:hypothetical protein [Campylobacter californiensis]|uniref:hypothetical protein n=1 Tax=Campylobacter californiensis TaxID=1032243 RepID=UPI0014759CD0|nr:hypothetical protein [Campylobacter sp. RM12916]MBE3610486.1 hypothetical protein [Campylobacter sp. RM12916]
MKRYFYAVKPTDTRLNGFKFECVGAIDRKTIILTTQKIDFLDEIEGFEISISDETLEQKKLEFIKAIDFLLDTKAKERGYDNIISAVSYAAMPNPFYDEGVAFFKWRSEVYTYCYSILEKVRKGELEISEENIAKVMNDIPQLGLPEASTQIEPSNEQGASNE